jgi:hypothetical protein
VLENAIVRAGTLFIVSDTPADVPAPGAIVSSREDPAAPPQPHDLQVVSRALARELFPARGAE